MAARRPFIDHIVIALLAGTCASSSLAAQAPAPRYPVRPVPLPDSAEIALARSAAPAEVSDSATILVVRAGAVHTLAKGTSGAVCMVSRDLHEGSAYPICFNPEAARTALQRELLQNRLRSLGATEDSVGRATDAAMASGTIPAPTRFAIAYMMSPQQVLFSTPAADGVRVGRWSPHIMIYAPHTSGRDVGLARDGAAAGAIQVSQPGSHHTEIIVRVPRWADGTPGTVR